MPSGNFMLGLAQGAQGIGTPTSRAEARARKAQSDAELRRQNLRKQEGIDEQEINILKEQNKKLLNEMARSKTYDAFRAYNSDLDPRHLNRALQDPVIKNLFPDVVAVDKINPTSDQNLIQSSGLDNALFEDSEIGPNALGRFVKIIKADGTMEISDLTSLQAATGYTTHMDNIELQKLKDRSIITKNLKTGKGEDTTDNKNAKRWGEILNKPETDWTSEDIAFNKLMIDKTQGNIAGQLGASEGAQADLLKLVGGDEGWQALDLTDRKTRLKVGPYIERMERLGGLELKAEDKKIITNMNKLVSLGAPAAKLTPEETGLMDSMWFRMKKYVPGAITDDDLRAIKAASGYQAFQNELRKVLYGSVLTPGEIEKFNGAYGTLSQQFPEVMAQLGTMLKGLQADLDTVSNFNNPYVVEYRLGGTSEKVEQVSENIDTILNNLTTKTVQTINPPSSVISSEPVDKKKVLDGIFRQ